MKITEFGKSNYFVADADNIAFNLRYYHMHHPDFSISSGRSCLCRISLWLVRPFTYYACNLRYYHVHNPDLSGSVRRSCLCRFLSDQLNLIFHACNLRYYHMHSPDLPASSGSSCLCKISLRPVRPLTYYMHNNDWYFVKRHCYDHLHLEQSTWSAGHSI